MDIDFSFWLTTITLITGVFWGLDIFVKNLGIRWKDFFSYVGSFFPVLFLVLFLRSFLLEPFQIPSGSMIPTLKVGDFILVNKFSYGVKLPVLGTEFLSMGSPERGDVVVFVPSHDERYFIKRAVGLPGDRVTYRKQKLFINGDIVPTQFIQQTQGQKPSIKAYIEKLGESTHHIQLNARARGVEGEWIVPEGHYFMLGDNRNLSEDSRYWGFVPVDALVGRAFAIWMHKDAGWSLPTFSRNGLIL